MTAVGPERALVYASTKSGVDLDTAFTALTFENVSYDAGPWHASTANTRLTVPDGVGYARLFGGVGISALNSTVGGHFSALTIYKNGSSAAYAGQPRAAHRCQSNTSPSTANAVQFNSLSSPIISVSSGDYFELMAKITMSSTFHDTSVDIDQGHFGALMFYGDFEGALVTKSSNQAGNFNSPTAVTWNQETYDTSAFHDNSTNTHRLSMPTGTNYCQFFACIELTDSSVNDWVDVALRKNDSGSYSGFTVKRSCARPEGLTETRWTTIVSPVLAVNDGTDHFEIYVQVNADTTTTITPNSWFACRKVPDDFSGCLVTLSADINATNFTAGYIPNWGVEQYDTDSYHSTVTNTSRLTVPTGVTLVNVLAGAVGTSISSGQSVKLEIIKNGSAVVGSAPVEDDAFATAQALTVETGPLEVTAGDYFEYRWTTESDTSSNLIQSGSWFAIEKLTPDFDGVVSLVGSGDCSWVGSSNSGVISFTGGASMDFRGNKMATIMLNVSGPYAPEAETGAVTFRMPYALTVQEVRANLAVAQSSGSIITVDINNNGTSILGTKLTIDNTEKTSVTAASSATITSPNLADDDEITIDIDQVGTATSAVGLNVYLMGTRT